MAKETKTSLINTMKGMLTNATKQGKDMIAYVVKAYETDPKSVTMADLEDTLTSLSEMVAPQTTLVPMENQIKKTVKGKVSEEEAMKQMESILDGKTTDKKENQIKKADAPKKEEKKEEPKKETKPSTKKADDGAYTKSLDYVAGMPKEFDSQIGKLKVRPDIKNIKELADRINNGEDLVVCAYWNKRQLKQFQYDPFGIQPKEVKSFPNDLDIIEIVYASENGLAVYGVSIYTEIHSSYIPKGFETDEETGLRYCWGVEYQIYEIVSEDKEEVPAEETVEETSEVKEEIQEKAEEIKKDAEKIPANKVIKKNTKK